MNLIIANKSGSSVDTTVTLLDGTPLLNISALDVGFRPNMPVLAQVSYLMPRVDVIGSVTVEETHLRELAAAHGFELKRKVDAWPLSPPR